MTGQANTFCALCVRLYWRRVSTGHDREIAPAGGCPSTVCDGPPPRAGEELFRITAGITVISASSPKVLCAMTGQAKPFFAPLRLCVIKKHGAEGQYRSVMPDQPTSPPHQLRLGRSATKASYQFAMGRSKMPPASSVECWGHSTPDHYKLPRGERGRVLILCAFCVLSAAGLR